MFNYERMNLGLSSGTKEKQKEATENAVNIFLDIIKNYKQGETFSLRDILKVIPDEYNTPSAQFSTKILRILVSRKIIAEHDQPTRTGGTVYKVLKEFS